MLPPAWLRSYRPVCRHVVSLSTISVSSCPHSATLKYFPYLTRYLAARADVVAPDSSSPSTKRSLKPSPIAANPQPSVQYSGPPELPSLQPAASFTTANPEAHTGAQPPLPSPTSRKRKSVTLGQSQEQMAGTADSAEAQASSAVLPPTADVDAAQEPKTKKSRTNTPWTPAEELRLKQMRDAGNSWSEIAKVRRALAGSDNCRVPGEQLADLAFGRRSRSGQKGV